jgi:hypothetical protein
MTGDGSGTRPARDRRLPAFIAVVVGVIAIALLSQARPAPAQGVPFPSVPAEACQAPASADKGGQTLVFGWQVAVETDRPQGSAIVFVSGADTLLCFVSRSADGMLGVVSSGIGGHRGDTRSGLTLDSGLSTPTHERDILVGRVPTGTATVRVGAGDGSEDVAVVGNGYYLAWFTGSATPVRIDALDASGHLLQRLEDPNGIQFGS